jgi:hydrogenase maturation protease
VKSPRILVAGVGNVFCGDDAFGVVVVGRLTDLPAGVEARDFGLRARDLAYELQDGYDGLILIDATARGGPPGTLYLIEPDIPDLPAACDGHGVTASSVLALARQLGRCPRAVVVGCEPATLEPAEGLSPAVEAAVSPALERLRRLIAEWPTPREAPT